MPRTTIGAPAKYQPASASSHSAQPADESGANGTIGLPYRWCTTSHTVVEELTTGELRGLIVLWPTDGAMLVDNVAVDPRCQGQGLARQLLAFAEMQARSAGLPEVRLYTNEAMTENLAFYDRLGFEDTGRRVDEGYKRVFLRKNARSRLTSCPVLRDAR